MQLPDSIENLIFQFSRLPGVGKKSAMRLALHLLQAQETQAKDLSEALIRAKEQIKKCTKCYAYTEEPLCPICSSHRRNSQLVCVVEKQTDLMAFERSGDFEGLYHVLGAAISPLDGIGPSDLHIPELLGRLKQDQVTEVILATSSSAEGESTAHFIDKAIQQESIRRTRLARGIPMGTELEFLDDHTLSRALQSRIDI